MIVAVMQSIFNINYNINYSKTNKNNHFDINYVKYNMIYLMQLKRNRVKCNIIKYNMGYITSNVKFNEATFVILIQYKR